ncbi:MAG: thiamine biosynthesis protein ThiF [Steroidobacteraceae bacterium]|jgi:hypothetical protein
MDSDSFHRLLKLLIDSGEASSILEALDTFSRYGVKIHLGRESAYDISRQIVALTAINCAARSFQGNVLIEGDDFELGVPGFEGTRLQAFLDWAGVKSRALIEAESWPRIVINDERVARTDVLAWATGWDFGIGSSAPTGPVFAPACVAAGGLAVNEAFSMLRQDSPYAGHRAVHLSLWDPTSPFAKTATEYPPQDALWLIGLGHLGQAYAWTLGFLPPGSRPLFLQDVDVVGQSTLSTSMVSHASDLGRSKSRVVARWLEARGYKTALIERRFDEAQRVRSDEPCTALFGVDNAAARRVIEAAGFRLTIDAGLGSGIADFRGMRVRTFPGPSKAATLWAAEPESRAPLAPAYRQLLKEGAEACGVTTLATRAVGAPFVGCVAAGYVLAERIRRQVGGRGLGFVDFHLCQPEHVEAG